MILIFSEEYDPSSSFVISWLNYYGIKWNRINNLEFVKNSFSYTIIDNKILTNYGLDLEKIKSIWCRRIPKRYYKEYPIKHNHNDSKYNELIEEINKSLSFKETTIFNSLFGYLNLNMFLGNPYQPDINKLFQLKVAAEIGMDVPNTFVTSSKNKLIEFKNKYSSIIVKPIYNISFFKVDKKQYATHTRLVDNLYIDELPEQFSPSLFQENIQKEFEIRTFYIDGKCYSMAIFSQNNKQTSVDFRIYDYKNPNRRTPFQLPVEIEKKIDVFMKKVGLNTGSLDFIYSKSGEIIFLEVNPVGQFGMVSYPCNYFLERIIANRLKNN